MTGRGVAMWLGLPCRPSSIAFLLVMAVPVIAWAQDTTLGVLDPTVVTDEAGLGRYVVGGGFLLVLQKLLGLMDRWTKLVEDIWNKVQREELTVSVKVAEEAK